MELTTYILAATIIGCITGLFLGIAIVDRVIRKLYSR